MVQLDRITRDPTVMGGKPCIRGMRVTVGMIVGQIGAGHTIEELLADYPYLEREDILQALRYAAWLAAKLLSLAHEAFGGHESLAALSSFPDGRGPRCGSLVHCRQGGCRRF